MPGVNDEIGWHICDRYGGSILWKHLITLIFSFWTSSADETVGKCVDETIASTTRTCWTKQK